MVFINWIWKIIKKWLWVLGLLPLFFDYIFTYIPNDYIPKAILDLTREGASWQLTGILIAIGFLISSFLVHEETRKEYEEKLKALERSASILLTESISDNSIDLSHFSTSAYNAIELRYIAGNEPIKIHAVEIAFIDQNGKKVKNKITQFFSLSDNLLGGHHLHLNILNIGEGCRFNTLPKDDVRNGAITVRVLFSGFKSGKRLEIEREIPMEPNQQWLMS